MKYVGSLLVFLAVSTFISGCTGGGGSQSESISTSPLTENPISGTNQISPEEAQNLIQKVQEDTASSQQYALTEQDANDLAAEGLIENDELKAWVK